MPPDIQRPIEESQPVEAADAPTGPGAPAEPLRPAAPAAAAGAAAPARPPASRRVVGWLRRAPGRSARSVAAWSRLPAGRLALPAILVAGLVSAAVATGGFVVPLAGGSTPGAPAASGVPTAPPPTTAPTPVPGHPSAGPTGGPVGLPADVLRGWAQQLSARTDIPVVALQAYGYAELVLTQTMPGCQLSWTTLAAIGRVESDHGRLGHATLEPDGRAGPAIIGPPLDGQGDRRLIEDTDNGSLDGDPVYDRAVGPMQFIPETWRLEQIDATGDGVADPHNIHDAALAAANYLCRQGGDLSTAEGWWLAVLAYNEVESYADEVFAAATDYGRRSRG